MAYGFFEQKSSLESRQITALQQLNPNVIPEVGVLLAAMQAKQNQKVNSAEQNAQPISADQAKMAADFLRDIGTDNIAEQSFSLDPGTNMSHSS